MPQSSRGTPEPVMDTLWWARPNDHATNKEQNKLEDGAYTRGEAFIPEEEYS